VDVREAGRGIAPLVLRDVDHLEGYSGDQLCRTAEAQPEPPRAGL